MCFAAYKFPQLSPSPHLADSSTRWHHCWTKTPQCLVLTLSTATVSSTQPRILGCC